MAIGMRMTSAAMSHISGRTADRARVQAGSSTAEVLPHRLRFARSLHDRQAAHHPAEGSPSRTWAATSGHGPGHRNGSWTNASRRRAGGNAKAPVPHSWSAQGAPDSIRTPDGHPRNWCQYGPAEPRGLGGGRAGSGSGRDRRAPPTGPGPRVPAAASQGSTPAAPSSTRPLWTARSPGGASRSSARGQPVGGRLLRPGRQDRHDHPDLALRGVSGGATSPHAKRRVAASHSSRPSISML